jgi:hypothetical protein
MSKDDLMVSEKNPGIFSQPKYLFFITLVTIFISESIVMFILSVFRPLPSHMDALLDASLLTVFVYPLLYIFFLKPMNNHMDERKIAEIEKDRVIKQLQERMSEIKVLKGIVPICATCKKIRNDAGYWQQVEVYVRDHSHAEFSHGYCPECYKEYLRHIEEYEKKFNQLSSKKAL